MAKNQKTLNWVDVNDIGDLIGEFEDKKLNKAFDKFCILDSMEATEEILEKVDNPNFDDYSYEVVQVTVEQTLLQINKVFKNLGLDLEFKQADMGEYIGYMLTGSNDTPAAMAKKIRALAKKSS